MRSVTVGCPRSPVVALRRRLYRISAFTDDLGCAVSVIRAGAVTSFLKSTALILAFATMRSVSVGCPRSRSPVVALLRRRYRISAFTGYRGCAVAVIRAGVSAVAVLVCIIGHTATGGSTFVPVMCAVSCPLR